MAPIDRRDAHPMRINPPAANKVTPVTTVNKVNPVNKVSHSHSSPANAWCNNDFFNAPRASSFCW